MPDITIDTQDQHIHQYDPRTHKCYWCDRPQNQLNGAWPVGTWFQGRRPIAFAKCHGLEDESK